MTDSMKFGPEWLRNLSSENTNASLSNGANAGGTSYLANSGNTANIGNVGGDQQPFGVISNMSPQAITQLSYAKTPRNTFPEFRYGREEMLSLFDKNYNLPEILPTFKKIFVEKAQLPLAFTPSPDEELMPHVPPATTRPTWMQRSPVSFNSSARGVGRVSSIDRGRMRGKISYHPIYQRSIVKYNEDAPRSVPLKIDRSWQERNGTGDLLSAVSGNSSGSGINSDWNCTSTSTPRKEFSSHPRNIENWRRNRNEDGSGDASNGITDDWRGSNNANNSRWGRSTSWREEDAQVGTTAEAGGNNLTIQRLHSTITTINERANTGICSGSGITKLPPSSYGNVTSKPSGRTFSPLSILNSVTGRAQWNANRGVGTSPGINGEDKLPEWAMENPLEGGGTFDASGAFLGSVDGNENYIGVKQNNTAFESEGSVPSMPITDSRSGINQKSTEQNKVSLECDSLNIMYDCSEMSVCTPGERKKEIVKSIVPKPSICTRADVSMYNFSDELESKPTVESKNTIDLDIVTEKVVSSTNDHYNIPCDIVQNESSTSNAHNSYVQRCLSDRMQEVADDMIEKLIMDDDTAIVKNTSNENETNPNISLPLVQENARANNTTKLSNVFQTASDIVKKPQNSIIHKPSSITPPITPKVVDAGQEGMQFYGEVALDNAVVGNRQQSTTSAATNLTSTSDLPFTEISVKGSAAQTDLWFYRDPQSKVQGPFTTIEMTEWYRAGYFNGNLYVRRLCDKHFRSLGELARLCNDNIPFTHSYLLPNLDDIPMTNTAMITATLSQKPQTVEDFNLKQQLRDDQNVHFKVDMSYEANYLGNTGKHTLPANDSDMYFQMLRNQEIVVYNELAKNEGFQQLTPSEKEAVVRQKLHLRADFQSNLTEARHSLASINIPVVSNSLYNTMTDSSEKDHAFVGATNTDASIITQSPQSNQYSNSENFVNSQQMETLPTIPCGRLFGNTILSNNNTNGTRNYGHASSELLNNLGMKMLLYVDNSNPTLNSNSKSQDLIKDGSAHFLNAEFLSTRNSLAENNCLLQPWIQPVINPSSLIPHQLSNEWTNNLLLENALPIISSSTNTGINVTNSAIENQNEQNFIRTSLWELPTEDQPQQEQLDNPTETKCFIHPSNMENNSSTEQETGITDKGSDICSARGQVERSNKSKDQDSHMQLSSTAFMVNKRKEEASDKVPKVTKRIAKHQSATIRPDRGCDETSSRKIHEDQYHKEPAEEKRRQKEEKRRQQQNNEEKVLEEKEHQQQMQFHRRKAMVGGNSSKSNSTSACLVVDAPTSSSKAIKEIPRVQSSIAPWSTQTNARTEKSGPCLAEIQKAERRERQIEQRQMETYIKRLRSGSSAAVEAYDSMLKWNSAVKDLPVKSLAEIQAEEANKIATEQIEIQRRRDQEQMTLMAVINSQGSKNISTTWGGTKVWGSTNVTGFWEDPTKIRTAANANLISKGIKTETPLSTSSSNNSFDVSKHSLGINKKSTTNASITFTGKNTNLNLKKSQTVSVMQSAGQPNEKNTKSNPQHSSTSKAGNFTKSQKKLGANIADSTLVCADKGGITKNPHNLSSSNTPKGDDYENEFIVWCMKSLSNMNTGLDVPTFITFLRDLESPYEVKDYIRMYLGEDKESTDFGKQFLERRSIHKNLQRAQNAHNDDMCKPAPAITPSVNDNSDTKLSTNDRLVVHWDGKILADLIGRSNVDRIAVLVSYNGTAKFLGAPKIESGNGKNIAQAVHKLLVEWGISEKVVASSFDTASSNTGLTRGACILLDELLSRKLINLACRYHIYEIVLKNVYEKKCGKSSAPEILIFNRFADIWQKLNTINTVSV